MRWLSCAVVLLALLGFPGCAAPEQSEPSETGSFVRAEWKNTEFHAEAAQSGNGAQIDVSSASQGYVGVSAHSLCLRLARRRYAAVLSASMRGRTL